MAITIGKTATVVLNRFCNLVLKPEPVATGGGGGGGSFLPGDFDFNDGNATSGYLSNTVTFTKSGTLYISKIDGNNTDWTAYAYKNGNQLVFWNSEATALANGQTGAGDGLFLYSAFYGVVSVVPGDEMYFEAYAAGPSDTVTVTLKTDSFSGTLISSFTITYNGI